MAFCLLGMLLPHIFVSVFHRILDFKAGLDFYLGPFFYAFALLHVLLAVFKMQTIAVKQVSSTRLLYLR